MEPQRPKSKRSDAPRSRALAPAASAEATAAEVGEGRSSVSDADLEPPPDSVAESTRTRVVVPPPRKTLDHVFEFVSFVGRQMPLSALLDGVPPRFSAMFLSDVVSIYLLEGDGEGLVLRANVGFVAEAQGRIRLRVGEGLTGLAVEQKQPVSVVRAPRHDKFRRFEVLDEDRFPIFLAVPILGPEHRSLGAVVLQRAEGSFAAHEIALVAALTAPIASGVRQAALIDDLRENKTHRKTGGGTRKITLTGHPIVGGRAMGALSALRRPAKDRKPRATGDEAKRVRGAFDAVEHSVQAILSRAHTSFPSEQAHLASYALMASDSRLRERALELIASGQSAAEALSTVAREVTRAATSIVGDPFLEQRSRDIEDLCDAVLMFASPDLRAEAPSKAVLIGEDLSMFDLIVTARTQPVGVALTAAASPRTTTLMKLLGVPAIADVQGAFRWVSPGDVVLVDADHGFFIVNPSRAEVAALRAYRRDQPGDDAVAAPRGLPRGKGSA